MKKTFDRHAMRNRRSNFETLEARRLLASDWHNAALPRDVDHSSHVSALDALLLIGELNRGGGRQLLEARRPNFDIQADVNQDGWLTALDALLIINAINTLSSQPPQIVGGLSPASDLNGNSVVLHPSVTINGQAMPHAQVTVLRTVDQSVVTDVLADKTGHFSVDLQLVDGLQTFRLIAQDDLGRTAELPIEVRLGNSVHDWNAAALDVVRQWTTFSNDPYNNRIVTSQPPLVARNLAMIHVAMFDAINTVDGDYAPIIATLPRQSSASANAAAASAAFTVASALYSAPDELALWQATLDEALASETDPASRDLGLVLGRSVGKAVIDNRRDDGARASVDSQPSTGVGHWQRTFPDYLPPLLPQWPKVQPFALDSGDEFRPAPPPDLASAEYAAAVDEVMQLGGFASSVRSREQTEIALFWADGGGTYTPPGHWNQIATDVSLQRGTSLLDTARTFALLNVAMADAGIASWDAKYAYQLWRPIDAIRQGALDNNPLTNSDVEWMPILKTPPFATYTSGHSTFSGAASEVLATLYGDQTSFVSRSDSHSAPEQRPLSASKVVTRQFASFSQAAEEAGNSRIYGGIHFRFDHTAGIQLGRQVGQAVLSRLLLSRM